MATEIERKFLVDKEEWQKTEKPEGMLYRQGYLSTGNHPTIRVRVAGAKAYITLKGRNEGIARKEFEYEIPVAEAIEMLDNFALSEVEKIRYRVYHENKLWEVDEFKGANAGLILAEIELQTENEAFNLPGWLSVEVSFDTRYYNANLSVNPHTNWTV
ncbi:MAG: CYTH domain-containing protein [Bacteroidota bacterium]